jgi:hypothetical protein
VSFIVVAEYSKLLMLMLMLLLMFAGPQDILGTASPGPAGYRPSVRIMG